MGNTYPHFITKSEVNEAQDQGVGKEQCKMGIRNAIADIIWQLKKN